MAGEGEGAVEFANRALADPEAWLALGLGDLLLASLCDLSAFTLGGLVVALAGFGGVVFALGAALDHEGLGVGEFNVDVLLGDTGKFAIEVVGIGGFADVEARRKGAHGGLAARGAVDVIVVQEAEERTEVAAGRDGAEERHFGCSRREKFVQVR